MATTRQSADSSAIQFRSMRTAYGHRIEAVLSKSVRPVGHIELHHAGNGQAELINLRVDASSRGQHIDLDPGAVRSYAHRVLDRFPSTVSCAATRL